MPRQLACLGRFTCRGTQVPLAPRQLPWAGFHHSRRQADPIDWLRRFLLQTLADILFEEFVDKEFVERRDVLSHICEDV
jgi:hypothetical protein